MLRLPSFIFLLLLFLSVSLYVPTHASPSFRRVRSTDTPQYYPNIDLFSQGYNLFKGNPRHDGSDPGLSAAIFDFSSVHLSDDKKWWIPDAFSTIESVDWCKFVSFSSSVESMVEYVSDLSSSVSVDSSFGWSHFGSSFTASKDFHSFTEILYNKTLKATISSAHCGSYHPVLWDAFVPLNFTNGFVDAILAISQNLSDLNLIFQFFELFGTHYIIEGDAGSRFSHLSYFTEDSWSILQESGRKITVSADADFYVFAAGASSSTSEQKELAAEFDSNRTIVEDSFVGCDSFITTHSIPSWESCSESKPYIVTSTLQPIISLLNSMNFPKISNLNSIVKVLNSSYDLYCHSLPGCGKVKIYPSSCTDLKNNGITKDGEYDAFYEGKPSQPMKLYCIGMQGSVTKIPLDYILLNESNPAVVGNAGAGPSCPLDGYTVHHAIPIDLSSSPPTIRRDDKRMATITGKIFTPMGSVFFEAGPGKEWGCCSLTTFSLQGTPFAFKDEVAKGILPPPTLNVLDEYRQVVEMGVVDQGFCQNCRVEYGLQILEYVGEIVDTKIKPGSKVLSCK